MRHILQGNVTFYINVKLCYKHVFYFNFNFYIELDETT
jgi:hypothetical protein